MSILITGKSTYHDDGSNLGPTGTGKWVRGAFHKRFSNTVKIPLDRELVRAYHSVDEIEAALRANLEGTVDAKEQARFLDKVAVRMAGADSDDAGMLALDKDLADRFDSPSQITEVLREYARLPVKTRRPA